MLGGSQFALLNFEGLGITVNFQARVVHLLESTFGGAGILLVAGYAASPLVTGRSTAKSHGYFGILSTVRSDFFGVHQDHQMQLGDPTLGFTRTQNLVHSV